MDYLGLHNKSKAEVHPEHMRTGPKEEEEELHISKHRDIKQDNIFYKKQDFS